MAFAKDIVSLLIEEVALEGLEGITLEGLWLRLVDRHEFGLKPTTPKIKQTIWNMLIKITCLDFYLLLYPRSELKIFDKISSYDDHGNNVLPPGYEEIYQHSPVNDELTGLMGSCCEYSTREKITDAAVKLSLNEAQNLWGLRLVIVADQASRRSVLCGVDSNPCWEFSANEYCTLERIGRSRRHGEITHGQYGLKLLHDDNKMLFYYRKNLIKRDLIKVQNFHLRIKNMNVTGKIIHLKRFSVPVKSKAEADSELIISFIKSQPRCVALYSDVQKVDIKSNLKKILKKMDKNVVSETVPYRHMFPDAPASAWKYKGSPTERAVRVVRLISEDRGQEEEDEEEEEEDENSTGGILDESFRCIGVPLLRQAYMALERSHIAGMTQTHLAKYLGLVHLTARALCKQLKRYKLCSSTMKDMGRQRVAVFHCNKFDTLTASIPSALASEKSKLLRILQSESSAFNIPNSVRAYKSVPIKTEKPEDCSQEPIVSCTFNKPLLRSAVNSKGKTTKITLRKNVDNDNIKTDIVVLKPEKAGKTSGLFDNMEDTSNLSLRLLKRANLILQAVNTHKIIQDPQKLQRMINEEEEQEGFSYTVDRKSVLRIIEKLELEGRVQRIRVTLSSVNKEKVFTFICHPSITPQHSEIQSAIDQAKMKLPIITKEAAKATKDPKTLNTIKQLQYDHRVGKTQYGFKPKFIRLRNMHFYLYYLIYNYTGSDYVSYQTKRNILSQNNMDSNLLLEMNQIYHDKLDWKMFIPPLPVHQEYGEGWCLVSDILLRLPLFVFLSLVNIPYRIPGIMEYLEHPLRKFYLVKDLPSEISNQLTIMRKYIFTLTEILQQLAFVGLVQFGPQMMKEKDQVFIYLNRNARLVDTIPSDEGYNHITRERSYDEMSYHFNSTDDLERYWSDLVRFAMNTKLGSKICVEGKEVVVESVGTKKQMLEALRPKTPEEVLICDIGYIPGDGLGAAGIDSDMFVHLKRNWYWSTSIQNNKADKAANKPTQKVKEEKGSKKSKSEKSKKVRVVSVERFRTDPVKEDIDAPSTSKGMDCSDDIYPQLSSSNLKILRTPITEKNFPRKRRHKKITRLVLPYPKKTIRKPYYDQKDREALKRMQKLRVEWSTKEDNILLLCKVANIFMCPYSLRQKMKNFTLIREILHKNLPEVSLNKTSRACQRRIQYMMKNAHTTHSVDICVAELNQDNALVSKYGHTAMNKLLNKYKDQVSPVEEFNKVYDQLFLELVELLIDRMKSVPFNKSVLENDFIPNSLDEFYSKYNVIIPCPKKRLGTDIYREPEEKTDIMSSVIRSIIHSSLACAADKTCYSYQLLHIYQQYPDKLLRTVIADYRSSGVISSKRFLKIRKRGVDAKLPTSTSPYKLSNSYMNRLMLTKFQYRIFSDSYYFFSNIISVMDSGEPAIDIEVNVNNGGECCLIIELFSLGLIQTQVEFPDQVIILDPKLSETEETFSRVLKRFNDLLNNMKSKKKDPPKGNETDYEDVDDVNDCGYEEFNHSNKNNLASAASRLALFSQREDNTETMANCDATIQHTHDYFVINPCKVCLSVQLDSSDSLQSLFTNFQEKDDLLSNIKKSSILPVMDKRQEGDAAILLKRLSPEVGDLLDFIKQGKELGVLSSDVIETFGPDIMSCIKVLLERQVIVLTGIVDLRLVHHRFCKPWIVLSYSLPRSVKDSLATGSDKLKDLQDMKMNESNMECGDGDEGCTVVEQEISESVQRSDQDPSSSVTSMEVENIFDSQSGADESNNVDDEEGRRKRLASIEDELVESLQPRKRRKQTSDQQKSLSTFNRMKESKGLKDVEVLIKPWLRVDGSLNRRVLDRFLGSVLAHVLNYPGLSVQKLQARFTPALQPSYSHELALMLRDLGCLSMTKVGVKPMLSLFSSRTDITIIPATGLEAPSEIILQPHPMAATKFSLFIGDKAYANDYLCPSTTQSQAK